MVIINGSTIDQLSNWRLLRRKKYRTKIVQVTTCGFLGKPSDSVMTGIYRFLSK